MSVIKIEKLWEKYRIKFIVEGKVSWEEVWALQEINLEIEKGEVVGIVGHNGAGKTTLLRLLAGMLVPDRGEISVEGRVAAIMELGAGLNPEFTGRENIIFNARVYGIEETKFKQKIDEIIVFSNLGKFIDAPLKYYSQGMYMRLAFALAIFAEPDILLIDDILAVGDEEAQQKCRRKIVELKDSGKTIILVSHDMSIIKNLCNRVIFVEKGRIVREGTPQSVVPGYIETAGEKIGIAYLEQKGLRVVFNNGRVSISYQGNYLSDAPGGYCSFFDNQLKIHSPSTNLSWEITSSSLSELTAQGRSREGGEIVQYFKMNLRDSRLNLSIHNVANLTQQHNFNLFLSSAYNRWVSSGLEGSFPGFFHKDNWQDLDIIILPGRKLGILTENEDGLPGLILESKTENGDLRVFNSGYHQEARILRFSFLNNQDLSFDIRVCPDKKDFDNCFIQERQVLAVQQQGEELSQKLQEDALAKARSEYKRAMCTISGGDCRLFVDKPARRLQIFYRDKEITADRGLYSILYLSEVEDCDFEIKKVSDSRLILNLHFKTFTQIWELSFLEGDVLSLKIKLEIAKKVVLDKRNLLLELSSAYQNWETPYEKGNLSFEQFANEIAPVRFKNSRVHSIAMSSNQPDQPRIIIEINAENDCIAGLCKWKVENDEVVCLNFQSVIPWGEKDIAPGSYDLFDTRIIFNGQSELKEKFSLNSSTVISRGDLKFILNNGNSNIFWKNNQLTCGLGIYTAVRSRNVWHDSCQAMWKLVKSDKQSVVMLGHWPCMPISQLWEIGFIEDSALRWTAHMEIHREIEIEIEQASIMLTNKYKKWLAKDGANGEFMDEFTLDYDIFPFRYWYGPAGKDGLVARGPGLPDVVFLNTQPLQMPRAVIEDSDYLYSSRLLQYQKNNNKLLVSKKYVYFSGVIKIENK